MKLDPKQTAVLTLDCQQAVFGHFPAAEVILPHAVKAVDFARRGGFHLIHVGVGFAPGYPEIPDTGSRFARVRDAKMFAKGTPSAAFHPSIFRADDLVVYKQRVSAFSENELQMILRARGVEDLVFFGIATSGIVLSTLRRAADLDFQCTVLKDACFDADPEVHRVLTEKVFAAQATVQTVDEFVAGQEKS